MPPKQNSDYAIGYRRPPECTRFKPGRSGNPSGRPKKIRTFHDTFSDELSAKVFVTEQGRRYSIQKRDALIKQIVNKAISGDVKMLIVILRFLPHELFKEPVIKSTRPPRPQIDYRQLPPTILQEMLSAALKGDSNTSDLILNKYLEEQRQISQAGQSASESETNSSTKPSL